MKSKFPLTDAYIAYILNQNMAIVNSWTDDERVQLWHLIKSTHIRHDQELVPYLKNGYKIALITPNYQYGISRIDRLHKIYPALKKTDFINVNSSGDHRKLMGRDRKKTLVVVLGNAIGVYNLMDNVNFLEQAGYQVIYEVGS